MSVSRRTALRAGTVCSIAPWFLGVSGATAALPWLGQVSAFAAEERAPQSVRELWSDFDPRQEPLETEVIREWTESGGTFRHIRYLIGTFKGKPARMAAIYGFPSNAVGKSPAVMHIHGGGQRASLSEVKFLTARGYAALSVNWGGSGTGVAPFNSPEGAQPGDPNTDWGAVDPSQLNVAGYNSLLPGPKQFFEDREHPKNNNWYLLTLGCRRGLTFLERQPEVDPNKLGVHGYSMGGNLTMYVAGSDDRVKVAVPAVGGSGWRWEAHEFNEGTSPPPMRIAGDIELFRRNLSFESYAPLIRCPVLHRSGTNDFHGWMDDVYRTNALIENQPTRYSWSPHLNHHLLPETAVAMPLWIDHYLQGGPALPETPRSEVTLRTDDRIPIMRVHPVADSWPVARCEIYYSVEADPRARFWRSAEAVREGDSFVAQLPLHSLDTPLFAFANVHHTLPQPVSLAHLPGYREPVRELCLSSLLHSFTANECRAANIAVTLKPGPVIDDFAHGFRDWYQLNSENLPHRQCWTRKLTDPLYRSGERAKLKWTFTCAKTNRLTFVLQQNEWRSYRGKKATFTCEREIPGAEGKQTLTLALDDFESSEGSPATWREIDQFGICASFNQRGAKRETPPIWNGSAVVYHRLEWI